MIRFSRSFYLFGLKAADSGTQGIESEMISKETLL